MQVKKIKSADFHLGNKLNGSKSPAKYGIFRGDEQVGVVLSTGGVWDAWDMACRKPLLTHSCGSLAQLKQFLASK